MKASIHISKNAIKVLAYSKSGSNVSVKSYFTHPLPDECVINGVIIDPNPVIDGLSALRGRYPQAFSDVSLVLEGSFVYTKRITVPGKMNSRMYGSIIRDEFSEISSDPGNLITTFYPVADNPDGSKQIIACGVENAHAQTYISIFGSAGIKLSSIHLGVQSLLRFISTRSEIMGVPFVLNIIDDVIMLSMIYHNGVNMFQMRSRLYGESREALVRSIADGLAGIIQFNKSQNFPELSHSLYVGLDDSDVGMIIQANQYPEINFGILDIYKGSSGAEQLPPDAHFVFLNALMPESEPDLFYNIRMLEKERKRSKPKNIMIPIVACTAFVIAAAISVVLVLMILMDVEVRDLKNWLNAPAQVEAAEHIAYLEANTASINELTAAVAVVKSEIATRPAISTPFIQKILQTGGDDVEVHGLTFNAHDGAIGVVATSVDDFSAAIYVDTLKQDSIINNVYYTGRNYTSDGFAFTIDVIKTGWREGATS